MHYIIAGGGTGGISTLQSQLLNVCRTGEPSLCWRDPAVWKNVFSSLRDWMSELSVLPRYCIPPDRCGALHVQLKAE